MVCKLVIKCKSEASSLITAYKGNIVSVMETHCFQIVNHLAIVSSDFLVILCLFLFICVTAERKIFFVYIHSYENCVIIHLMTSICMR